MRPKFSMRIPLLITLPALAGVILLEVPPGAPQPATEDMAAGPVLPPALSRAAPVMAPQARREYAGRAAEAWQATAAEAWRAIAAWPRRYTVRAGDTLSSVARAQYGSARWWPDIYYANRRLIRWADQLTAGWVLTLPRPGAVPARPPAQLGPPPPPPPAGTAAPVTAAAPAPQAPPSGTGILTPAQVGAYWLAAGGPAWAEQAAETVAMCESGDNTAATNPHSGAAGLWQILGQVVPGDIYDPSVNAANAVAKFTASGDTWAQWTCAP